MGRITRLVTEMLQRYSLLALCLHLSSSTETQPTKRDTRRDTTPYRSYLDPFFLSSPSAALTSSSSSFGNEFNVALHEAGFDFESSVAGPGDAGINSLAFEAGAGGRPTANPHAVPQECPAHLSCQLYVACATAFQETKKLGHLPPCLLHKRGGIKGVCCPQEVETRPSYGPRVFPPPQVTVPLRHSFTLTQLNTACKSAFDRLKVIQRNNNDLMTAGTIIPVATGSPASGHQSVSRTGQSTFNLGQGSILPVFASESLRQQFGLSDAETGFGLNSISTRRTILREQCMEEPGCPNRTLYYRQLDGSCNNLRNPNWGRANSAMQRLLPAAYEDGVFLPRMRSVTGRPLPSPRVVRVNVGEDMDVPDLGSTLMVMVWGQFITHDINLAAIFKIDESNTGIMCCMNGTMIDPPPHPGCFPIPIPRDDPFFSRFNQRCMEFVRSMPGPRPDCGFGHAEQMNQITHFIDASGVYGSSLEESIDLRTFSGGLLAGRNFQQSFILPVDDREDALCENSTMGCLRAGDTRVNEQPGLGTLHTVFLRIHNTIARDLGARNPHWEDETIYQETRRIIAAIMQHITYNEFLPVILGREYMAKQDILPRKHGFADDYSETLNPSMVNEFQAAAFRFGHSQISGILKLIRRNGGRTEVAHTNLSPHLLNPNIMYTNMAVENLIRGFVRTPSQSTDRYFTGEVSNRLFQGQNDFGLDLPAINMQRGRDHGLPGYNSYRELCGLPRAKRFEDLLDVMDHKTIAIFSEVYEHVDDIDLYIGGVAELRVPGTDVGPTFHCILSDMFTRLKKGDRFWYENGGLPNSFTADIFFSLHPLPLLTPFPLSQQQQQLPPDIPHIGGPRSNQQQQQLPPDIPHIGGPRSK
ncbi:unnamed protein product [Cyprideis torosa]|uniref:Uncharacterized protein n=1 Tax=Cyprideis torosa TaxID=163714 RepID=A0A7R8ZGB9_9CRUS|nr:unnamed protein product [Cyprideis torosa]CAG0879688.1 unnamed protein product [Cyprideis torosa]